MSQACAIAGSAYNAKMSHSDDRPRLRPVELVRDQTDKNTVTLRDPSGHAPCAMSVSGAALFVLSMLDGRHDRLTIQAQFMRRVGRMLLSRELDALLAHLDEALFLESPRFAEHIERVSNSYRQATRRPMIARAEWNGQPGVYFDNLLSHDAARPASSGRLLGLVAPHLDYARGRPCYAAAYRALADRTDATRFVVLGTNHFGSCASVVGTRKNFDTPLGEVPHDGDFMTRLDAEVGADLCAAELDHAREHSVELQVALLRHVLKDRPFTIVPYLCPDPCGPTGTRPRNGDATDLRDFALALGRVVRDDPTPSCIIAGADLSHVGAYFNDDTPLDPPSLERIESSDRRALAHVESGDPEAFRAAIAATGNATSICSVGCIYALAIALHGRAAARLCHYHQALAREVHNCVTCCAIDFVAAP